MNSNTRPSVDEMFKNMIGRQERTDEQATQTVKPTTRRKNTKKTVQVTVRLRPDQHKRLKAEAFHRDCDMSELVRRALDRYFS